MQVSPDQFRELGERRRAALERAAAYGLAVLVVSALGALGALRQPGVVVAALAGGAASLHALALAHGCSMRRLDMLDEALVHGWRASLPRDDVDRRERALVSSRHRERVARALYREAVELGLRPGALAREEGRRERTRLIAIARVLGDEARPVEPQVLVLAGRLVDSVRARGLMPGSGAEHGRALARVEETLGLADVDDDAPDAHAVRRAP